MCVCVCVCTCVCTYACMHIHYDRFFASYALHAFWTSPVRSVRSTRGSVRDGYFFMRGGSFSVVPDSKLCVHVATMMCMCMCKCELECAPIMKASIRYNVVMHLCRCVYGHDALTLSAWMEKKKRFARENEKRKAPIAGMHTISCRRQD